MSVLVFDRIEAVANPKFPHFEQRPRERPKGQVPSPIKTLLAKAGIDVPSDGRKIPLGQIDKALQGLNPSERIRIKAQLADYGVID